MASTDPEPHVRVEVYHAEDEARTAIRVLVIQRPAVRNAVDDTTYSELTAALADAAADASVGAVILTGDGDFFTAGADLKAAMLRGPPADFTTAPVTAFMDAVLDFPKALVLAVNGPAIGIGMTILPHADFVFANATASCWVPFLSLGLVPEFGSSLTFPERMGRALAMEVLAGERRLSAEEALRVGLYGSLLPSRGSEFRRQVVDRVRDLLSRAPFAAASLVEFKRLMNTLAVRVPATGVPSFEGGTLPSRSALLRAIVRAEFEAINERVKRGETGACLLAAFERARRARTAKL